MEYIDSRFKYPVGQKYMRRDLRSNHLTNLEEIVTDRITVVNNKGEVIKQYYIAIFVKHGRLNTFEISENEITHALCSRNTGSIVCLSNNHHLSE